MKPYGKGKRGVLVVGEAPGESEDEQGRPFVGKSGQLLRDTFRELDFEMDRMAWTTNALICRPPKNQTPDEKRISYCRPNLFQTIQRLQPKVIVTLGRSALSSLLGPVWTGDIGTMDRWVGWTIPLESYWVCPTWHPSYLLRMKSGLMDRLFKEHLEAALLRASTPVPGNVMKDFHPRLLFEDREIYEGIRALDEEGGWAAVDYETNCLKPEWPEGRIVSCAISNGRVTISYPWTPKAKVATSLFLRSNRTKKISSNLKMEERWTIKEFGRGVENWRWDTMLAAHCLDNRTGVCSLKFQAFVKMGVPSYNDKQATYLDNVKGSPYNRILELDLHRLLHYGATDAYLECQLARVQRKELGYG
jgi:uracil-DNA glycosylase family 4